LRSPFNSSRRTPGGIDKILVSVHGQRLGPTRCAERVEVASFYEPKLGFLPFCEAVEDVKAGISFISAVKGKAW
jgi:hypothetical protein